MSQQRPNMFTTRIANVGPGQEVEVQLHYHQRVAYDRGKFSLRYPMTITPRYMPGNILPPGESNKTYHSTSDGWAQPTDQVPDADKISPYLYSGTAPARAGSNRVAISGTIDMGMPLVRLQAFSHELNVEREAQAYRFSLAGNTGLMDRDFVLSWRVPAAKEPQAAVFREFVAGHEYAMLMVLPPAVESQAVLPRRLLLVIDTSGSMGGASIRQARQSLKYALNQLRPGDEFNVVAFNTVPTTLFDQALPVSQHNIRRAHRFVDDLQAGGGTEMRAALQLALLQSNHRPDGQELSPWLRQVLFVTDGAVGNEQNLFKLIEQKLDESRFFAVGIGSAPNSWFVRKASELGRGVHRHIGSVEEVEVELRELFDVMGSTVSADIQLSWPNTAPPDMFPQKVPDLYAGQPLLVVARLTADTAIERRDITATGKVAGGKEWQRQIVYPRITDTSGESSGIASLWARGKIAHLLDEQRRGGNATESRPQILQLALQHKLLSPYTSFVAVEEEPIRPLEKGLKTRSVPNVRPAGQSSQAYAYPRTATRGPLSASLGIALLLVALLLISRRRNSRVFST